MQTVLHTVCFVEVGYTCPRSVLWQTGMVCVFCTGSDWCTFLQSVMW